jgi:hypothetical protein
MLWRTAIFALFLALNISVEPCFVLATSGEKDQPHALASLDDVLSEVSNDVAVDLDDLSLTSALVVLVENRSPMPAETLALGNTTSFEIRSGLRRHRWCCVELC